MLEKRSFDTDDVEVNKIFVEWWRFRKKTRANHLRPRELILILLAVVLTEIASLESLFVNAVKT